VNIINKTMVLPRWAKFVFQDSQLLRWQCRNWVRDRQFNHSPTTNTIDGYFPNLNYSFKSIVLYRFVVKHDFIADHEFIANYKEDGRRRI